MKLDDVKCPNCGSKNASARSLELLLARILLRLTKRILPVQAKCADCGASFSHLHKLPRTVIGYHGCNKEFADGLVAGRISLEEWKASKNSTTGSVQASTSGSTHPDELGSGRENATATIPLW
jgi:DNA-directed RNA polymerase subunit RPC12/RpoP